MNELKTIVQAIDNKKGLHIEAIDVTDLFPFADYFVICEANSDRQLDAIVSEIKDEAHKANLPIKRIEGVSESGWVLVEVNDVVIHIFSRDQREHFGLERLWTNAKSVDISSYLD